MRRSHSLIGLIGLLLVFFGLASWAFTLQLGLYSVLHLAGGALLLLWFTAASFRDLGALASARQTRQGANMVTSAALFIAVLVALNWLAVRHDKRFDLTDEGVFSLSPQATSVLAGLQDELLLQAFLEAGHNPAIEDQLESFAHASPQVRVQLVDPDRQPELAQEHAVRAYGAVRVAYGSQSTMVDQPTEETLTNAIINVTRQGKRTLCWVDGEGEPGLDDATSPRGYGFARDALTSENYEIEPIVLLQEGTVPANCNVVILAAPQRPLLDPTLDALRKWLASGGRALFLLPPRSGDTLTPLLAEYGITLGNDAVVDEVVRLFQGPALGLEPVVSTYGAHPITRDFHERTLYSLTRSVSPLEPAPKGVSATALASTSPTSWAETDLEALFKSQQAALTEGTDKSGPVAIATAATADLKEMGRGEGEARLVVFGTAAFADNKYLNTLFNRDLFLNALGWLAGQEDLVSIRPRSVRASRVSFSQDEASAIFYLSVLVVPELLMVLGLAVWWRRSSL